jgi:hypothetical protein
VIPLAVPDCRAADLRPLPAMLQGATGSMLGGIRFRNVSPRRCTVGGRPRVKLVLGRRLLDTKLRSFARAGLGGHSVTTIGRDGVRGIDVQWRNWCGVWPKHRLLLTVTLRISLTTGVRVSGRVRTGRPRCDLPSVPSDLFVSTFGTAP